MRVHVVSDVHGRAEALAAAGGADGFICLGDLLLFIDYADHRQGIFPELFGAEATRTFVALRLAKRFDEAREFSRALWGQLDGDPSGHVQKAASSQYAELFAAMPEPAYMTYGNVDIPPLWQPHLKPGHEVLDGQRATLGGWTFGFVGGGLPSAYRTPYEIDEDAYAAKVTATGEVDVLCTHIPPAVRSCSMTPWRAGSNGAVRPSWSTSAAPSPGTPCSATCTSRWPAGSGSAVLSASTWGTSGPPGSRTSWNGTSHRDSCGPAGVPGPGVAVRSEHGRQDDVERLHRR